MFQYTIFFYLLFCLSRVHKRQSIMIEEKGIFMLGIST